MDQLRSALILSVVNPEIRMDLKLVRLWMLLFFLAIIGLHAQAQTAQGRIQGSLRDPSGGLVRGGTIRLKSLDSGLTRSAVTDLQGHYAFDSLAQGRYRVAASAPGFEPSVRDEISVNAGKETVVDFDLKIARTETLIVVTAPAMIRPLAVETDPRAPRQPIPANDGADYLKNIPGFSIIRKGGTDGDPVLRGMAGSRLNVLLDGQQILGGCGGRMDPPTAYVFPSAYDRITVLKGPQTVLYGPNASAGTVLFERNRRRVEKPAVVFEGSATVGSYGRHDEMVETRAAIPNGYVQATATRAHSNDYSDGNGTSIHSFYTRWSGDAALGWTPANDSYLELSLAKSDAEAAYADRAMDGTQFARQNMGVRFDRQNISSFIERVEAQAYYNYIDHVMDNFSLRTPGTTFLLNNPDRRTIGGRAAVTLTAGAPLSIVVGFDTQRNIHRLRNISAKSASLALSMYSSAAWPEDMRFNQVGVFAEATRILTRRSRIIGGFRSDWHRATDSRPTSSTFGLQDHKTLRGGFGRYELDLMRGRGTLYAGVGHVERFPDYWERAKADPVTLKSAFLSTRPEKTTQLDTGMLWRAAALYGSISGFYGKVHDYILIRWSPTPALARNVDATIAGGEADVSCRFLNSFRVDGTLAFVHSNNDTDHKPLAQQPPLEGRAGLTYDNHGFTLGALARLVGRQDRVDIGSGNIVANGMDLGPTAGFSVFSFNGSYRLKGFLLVSGGVDNVLDKAYAEHLSRSGAMVPGFVQLSRINEPGRTFWLKANVNLD